MAKALFDADVSHEAEDVDAALAVLMGKFLRQAGLALLLPRWAPLPTSQLLKRAVKRLDKVIYGIIEQRRASGQMSGDLLSAFLQTRDDAGIGMTDRQLHDEIMTLFLAGHETTANVLSWTWLLLGQNPEIEVKLFEELDRVLTESSHARRPAAPPLHRHGAAGIDASVSAGVGDWAALSLHVSPGRVRDPEVHQHAHRQYLMHRDARYFPEPERFDPERWRAGDPRAAALPRFAYFPFSGGPRVCIGAGFGMMEAVLLLATIAQKFEVDVALGEKVSMLPSIRFSHI